MHLSPGFPVSNVSQNSSTGMRATGTDRVEIQNIPSPQRSLLLSLGKKKNFIESLISDSDKTYIHNIKVTTLAICKCTILWP